MPLMPPREPRPVPLARAQARLAFDALVRERASHLRRDTTVREGETAARGIESASLLEALAQAFVDAVDRENSSRGILRAGVQVEYVDAVVLTGNAGALVVDAIEYDGAPVYWQAKAGEPDSVIRGRDLDGYLRTGEQRYAEQLGLDS